MNLFPKIFDLDFLLNLDDESQLYNLASDQFHEMTQGFYAMANQELLRRLRFKPDARVLELACGTGHLANEIAKLVTQGSVVGVDMSSQMLTQGRAEADRLGLKNIQFIERNIHHLLPEFKTGDFDVGISCFALSYLGCDFLLKELYRLLGESGQVGITTSSIQSLIEWHPIFLPFLGIENLADVQKITDVPLDAEDMKRRMEIAGFKNVQVVSKKIPMIFKNSREAASYLISAGWVSNYFFSIKDKETRRQLLEWACQKVDEHHRDDPHISTSIEFLVAWNG